MSDTTLKRRPIRGVLYGIFFGLGLMMIVVGQGWAALGTTPPFVVLLVGIVLGALWGMYGPAKPPKGEPPREAVEVAVHDEPPPADTTPADTTPADAAAVDAAAEAPPTESTASVDDPGSESDPPT